ncbi:MAG: glycosyltransferase family 2 protein [Synergistaceae bacterium]|nr:glycosyltransferase family 2 protein [Synergistaceae bacterium]
MSINKLISVIIPAYNAASRIKFTLESIINQDYENIEIILVNDSSSDDTASIANKILSESNKTFRIINHEFNKGVCASRNTGLEVSRGEYICFVDADDVLKQNFISCLYQTITRDDCEIAFCGLVDRFTDGTPDKNFHSCSDEPYIESGGHFIINNFVPPFFCCMYNSCFLSKYNLLFHNGCIYGEDIEFITKALCTAQRVSFTQEHLYIYVHHNEMGSVRDNDTKAKKILRYEHNTQAQERTAEYLLRHSQSEQVKTLAEKILMPQVIIRKCNIFALNNNYDGFKSFIHDPNNRKVLISSQSLRVLIHKPEVFLKAFMLLHIPGIYYKLRNK